MRKKAIILVLIGLLGLPVVSCFAATSTSQEASGQERMREMEAVDKRLMEKVEQPKPKTEIEDKTPTETPTAASSEKISIKKITVTGATLLTEKAIRAIVDPYENKELTMKEIQKVADLITDAYRQKGYITSRAYLPPQKIEANQLEIRIIEGQTGEIEVKGNKFFSKSLYEKQITLKKKAAFNYNKLRFDLSRINQRPDRNVKAVLTPGKEPGQTDVVLEVKDKLPLHLGLGWDNYGSRYIEKNRYNRTITHNNLLGLDDSLMVQYQSSDSHYYRMISGRYVIPITNSNELGFYVTRSKLKLSREFEDLRARGNSKLYGMFMTQNLFTNDNFSLSANMGFDYKDIYNFQLSEEQSRDRLRVAKTGLDADLSDNWGRTIFSNEIDFGIARILGGMDDIDSRSSRAGAGGEFVKGVINLLRLQNMPFSSRLLLKTQMQFSPYVLTAAEQFQIGGISNVRAYPPAEFTGDVGYTSTAEWLVPPYFIPKSTKIPFCSSKFYDAVKLAFFYDWGAVHLRNPQAGEKKGETLRGAGCGIRINLPEDFSARVDVAWAIADKRPSDANSCRTWASITKNF